MWKVSFFGRFFWHAQHWKILRDTKENVQAELRIQIYLYHGVHMYQPVESTSALAFDDVKQQMCVMCWAIFNP